MTKKMLKQLVTASYTQDAMLNKEAVERIAQLLKKSELRVYINALKKREKENSVIISLPAAPNAEQEKHYKTLFKNKHIVYNISPELLLGMQIVENDLVTYYSLRQTFQSILTHIKS